MTFTLYKVVEIGERTGSNIEGTEATNPSVA